MNIPMIEKQKKKPSRPTSLRLRHLPLSREGETCNLLWATIGTCWCGNYHCSFRSKYKDAQNQPAKRRILLSFLYPCWLCQAFPTASHIKPWNFLPASVPVWRCGDEPPWQGTQASPWWGNPRLSLPLSWHNLKLSQDTPIHGAIPGILHLEGIPWVDREDLLLPMTQH